MRFVSYRRNGRPSFGLVVTGGVVDLGGQAGNPGSLKEAIAADVLRELGERHRGSEADFAIDAVELLPVIPDPDKILCIGLNYETHRLETGRNTNSYPTVFTRFADTQLAAGNAIRIPPVSNKLDYEGELAVVIGKGGRYIDREDAFDHVAGYACYNDATFRDWQNHSHQFIPGKNFPATAPFGPELVTPDEVGSISAQRIQTRLNGATVQDATLGDMLFSIPEIIAYISGFTPLSAGDVIATGTPGGVGAKREPQLFMKAGDVVEVEIDGIGLLRSPIRLES